MKRLKDAFTSGNSIAEDILKSYSKAEFFTNLPEISEEIQVVTFVAKEKIDLYGKTFEVDHFKLRSKDMNLPKDKRLDFDIWYDQKTSMILRVTYSRMGNWEYRLKNFE